MNELRNHFIPIRRLPSEILAHIFSILTVIDPPRKNYSGWIRTSHACCYWRQAAIEHSKLWANISLDLGERWVLEMSKRTKEASLVFKSACMERSIDLIVPHWPRTKAIILCSPANTFPKLQFMEAPAPMLEHIELTVEAYRGLTELPQDPFSGHAPLLRTAFFSGVVIP